MTRFFIGLTLMTMFFLSSCAIDELNFTNYQIEGIKNAKYIGTHQENGTLPASFSVLNVNGSVPIYLNGANISGFLKDSKIAFDDVKEYLKQGENLIQVHPMSFGPSLHFSFDNDGPIIDVVLVESVNDTKNIEIITQDASIVSSVIIEPMNYSFDGFTGSDGLKTSTQSPTGLVIPLVKNQDRWENTSAIPESEMYRITATDEHGYSTVNHYLRMDQKINDVFKLRMNKEVLDLAVPMIVPKIEGMHIYSKLAYDDYKNGNYPAGGEHSQALDAMAEWWKSSAIFYSDMGAKTTNENNCGYYDGIEETLNTGDFYCTNVKTDKDNKKYCLPKDVQLLNGKGKPGECSRIVISRLELDGVSNMTFTLKDTNPGTIRLDMGLVKKNKSKALYADMGIRNIQCEARFSKKNFCTGKFLGLCTSNDSGVAVNADGSIVQQLTMSTHKKNGSDNAFCKDNGAVTAALVANLGDMQVTADSGNPKGDIRVQIKNGDLNLSQIGTSLNLDGLSIGGSMSGLSWLISLLSDLLDSTFVNIAFSTIKQNLGEFRIGFDLFTGWDEEKKPSMKMSSHGYQVTTNADNNANTPLNWYMQYAGFLNINEENLKYVDNSDPDAVHDVLGSLYDITPISELPDSGSSMDLAININIINQALMSFYLSGISHISVIKTKDGTEVMFGPHATDIVQAQNGDKRIELIPRTQGTLEMSESTNNTKGSLFYRNAKMRIQTYKDGWETNFIAEVNFKLGVKMVIENDIFNLRLLGTPELEVLNIKIGEDGAFVYNKNNKNIFINEGAVKAIIQTGVNLLMNFAVPVLEEQIMKIDYPIVNIPGTLKGLKVNTKKISANNNKHLNFALDFKETDCTLSQESQNKLDEDSSAIVFCE